MLNMTKSKHNNEQIFGGVAIAIVVVIAGYFGYKYYEKKKEDTPGHTYCDSSANAFTPGVRKKCNKCFDDPSTKGGVETCEVASVVLAEAVKGCIASGAKDCDACIGDATDKESMAACYNKPKSQPKSQPVGGMLATHASPAFAAKSVLKSFESEAAKYGI
jgi:hypothetical protein